MWNLRYVGLVAVLGLGLAMTAGCGKSDTKSADSAAAAVPAAPTEAVTSADPLIGTWWVTDDKAPMMGIEFGKDQKAVVTVNLMQSVTADYAVMDGGRLRLVLPDGQTQIFKSQVDAQALALAPESGGEFPSLHLKKLQGQTIADAQHAKQQAMAKQRDALLAALRAKLSEPALVLESADPSLNLSRVALSLTGGPDQWQGTATTESNPPLLRHASANLVNADPPRLQVVLDQVQGPPGEADRTPATFSFASAGAPDALELKDNGLTLKSDADATKAITDAYQQLVKDRQTAIATFADRFGAFCVLQGDFHPAGAPATATPTHAALGLLRIEDKPAFKVANLARNDNPSPTDFNGQAVIAFDQGKPVLLLQNYGGAFTDGGSNQLQGTLQNMPGTLAIEQRLTAEDLQAKRKVVDAFIQSSLNSGVRFVGTMLINQKPELPVPVAMDLKTDGNLNLSGTIDVPHLGEGQFDTPGKVAETLFGAILQFEGHQKLKPGMSTLMGSSRKATLSLTFDGTTPKLSGTIYGGYQSGPAQLSVASDAATKARHDLIAKTLSDGAVFVVTDPRPRSKPPVNLNLKLDADGSTVTGTSTPGAHDGFFNGGGALHGTLADSGGFVVLDLTLDPGADARKRPTAGGELKFWVLTDDNGQPVLSGYWSSSTRNPPAAEPAKAFLAKP
ncbi:MAG: hypothetical protein ACTHM6_18065 [Tepidisphaeraceae bacterium]